MTKLMEFSGHPMVHALGWTLLHFCWQGLLVAALLWCVLGLLDGRSSQARYGAACFAMMAMVVLPAITFVRIGLAEYHAQAAAHRLAAVIDLSLFLQAAVGNAAVPWPVRMETMLDGLMPWLLSAWFIGALFFVARLSCGLAVARRLHSTNTQPASPQLIAVFERLRIRLQVKRTVRLLHSARVQVPTVIGWLRPVVLVPASCLTGLSTAQLEAIFSHELAHIRRHDYLVSVLQSLAEALLFYHPAIWWVSKQVRCERECCCDRLAVGHGGDALGYARALSYLEERRAGYPEFVLGANGGALTMRIRRLLGYREIPAVSPLAAVAICAALMATAGVYAGGVAHAEPQAGMRLREPIPLIESETPSATGIQLEPGVAVPRLFARAAVVPAALQTAEADNAAPVVALPLAGGPVRLLTAQADNAAPMATQYLTWLMQDVVWIISPEERAAYLKLSNDDERDQFIQQFWERRDQMAGRGGAKAEHYARMAYANEHFASDRAGWATDRGHIYIVLGKPDSIDSHPSGDSAIGGLPYEVWHYGYVEGLGDNINLTFVEVREGGDYRLKLGPSGLLSPGPLPFTGGPVRVSSGIMAGQTLKQEPPIYPPDAKAAHVSGVVVLHATISKEGTIATLSPVSGPAMLVSSAMEAVKQWTYKPYLLNGQPTEVETTINVNYTFGESEPAPPNAAAGEARAASPHADESSAHSEASSGNGLRATPGRMADGATPPMVIHTVEPEYTDKARKAKTMGVVLLNLIVDEHGRPENVHVMHAIGHGLDQKAIEAVKQYRFKPAMKGDRPVAENLNIEVNFQIF